MARRGDIIDNLRGEKLVFRQTAGESSGQRLEFDVLLEPGAGEKAHAHPSIAEQFEVISGIVRFTVAGYSFTAIAGETFTVPAGEAHAFENVGAKDARVRVVTEPAGKMEALYETLFALAHTGKVNPDTGKPNFWQMAVLMAEYRDELYAAPAARLAALIARILGYKPYYKYPYTRTTAEVERTAPAHS